MKKIGWSIVLAALALAVSLCGAAAEGGYAVSGGNADRVHLRAEPSLSSASLGLYFSGTPVDVLGTEENGFRPVSIGMRRGYMSADYIGERGSAAPKIRAGEVWAGDSGRTPLYAGPGDTADVIGYLQGLQRVLVLGQTAEGFYDVTAGSGARGYAAKSDLRLMDAVQEEKREEMHAASIGTGGALIEARLYKSGLTLDRYGSRVHEIEIIRDGVCVQRLWYICETVPQDAPHLDFSDMNMDGYPDLVALRTLGASDAYAAYFLYDPLSGMFERCLALEGFSAWRYELLPEDRIIVNHIRLNAAETRREFYRWQGDELILME